MKSVSPKHIVVMSVTIGLSACAHLPPVEPQIVTKTVEVPVAVACIDRSAVPNEPAAVAIPLNDARLAADIVASQALAYKAYGRELFALIQPCIR